MNNTTTSIVAILMIATLVVGATFAATTVTTQSAFAVGKKGSGGAQQEGSNNGNTIIPMEINSKSSANGFDGIDENEPQNQICTHPNNNGVCSQEGITSITSVGNTTTVPTKRTCEQCFTTILRQLQINSYISRLIGISSLSDLCIVLDQNGISESAFREGLSMFAGVPPTTQDKLIACLKNIGIVFRI
jgi:hypothetical protein